MDLECAYSSLGCVPPLHIGREKLVSYSPFFSHQFLVFLTSLVVNDLEVYEEVLVLQSLYDDGIGVEAVDIIL